MKKVLALSLFLTGALVYSQEKEGAKSSPGHDFLKQFAGTWKCDMEMSIEPGKPPEKGQSTMVCNLIGNYWAALEVKGEMGGMAYHGKGAFGYDEKKKEYVGTWIDNMSPFLWKYNGDSKGKSLTLYSQGPNPIDPNQLIKIRDVYEFQGKDRLLITSSFQGPDEKWVPMMKGDCKKK